MNPWTATTYSLISSLITWFASYLHRIRIVNKKTLRPILNKTGKQNSSKQRLYSHLSPISKGFQVRRTRHVEHSWRSRNELIGDVLLGSPSHGRASFDRPVRTYRQQVSADTGCSLEDLMGVMGERERDRERERERESEKSGQAARFDDDDDFPHNFYNKICDFNSWPRAMPFLVLTKQW